ncbi:MAG TPA: hypothetical protein VEA69_04520 [Tepidisphaeraceae bacterium]|nr:hypothetical protein [Tepidisphaeraceae bacterium]
MPALLDFFRRMGSRQVVRPWALCAPIVVILICLPLLRPLRSPGDASEQELSRLATIQALVERRGQADPLSVQQTEFFELLREKPAGAAPAALPAWVPGDAVPGTIVRRISPADPRGRPAHHYYSDRPPVLGFLLSGAYEGLHRSGYTFESHPAVVAYVLTLLGVTLPVAGAAGLVYRMGRLFELPRPARAALALVVVLGSGLIGYGTALNSHAPAAALVLGAGACLLHIQGARRPARGGAWLMLCGFCAALAATIDLSAGIFLVLLVLVIPALRWGWGMRVGGVLLYLIGATPPIVLHLALTLPITGDALPGFLHPELAGNRRAPAAATADEPSTTDDSAPRPAGWKLAAWHAADAGARTLIGSRGLLTHFPIAVLGVLGIALVLRRHWPASTKVLAAATLAGAGAVVVAYTADGRADWSQAMLGPRWFIVFLPVLVFWAGAWLRRPHHPVTWSLAAVVLVYSAGVSLIGAAAPFVKAAPGQYTVAAALKHMTAADARAPRPAAPDAVAGK